MKSKYLFLILFLGLFCRVSTAQAPRKIALIVAVGDYPVNSGWAKINSANDADLVREVLLRQGFNKSDITILRDKAATREGILLAIRKRLIEAAKSGDVLYFQFSGHGQQVADNNGVPDELDGFDEALVPIDSPMKYGENGYTGQKLIRDEEIGALFQQARQRIGPKGNLLVILDACHSGTGTRGMDVARGTDWVMADSNYVVKHLKAGKENGMLPMEGSESLAPMVAFFGASAEQLNFETHDESGKPMGSLTYAFCKKLGEANASTTYRGLFDQIRLEMAKIAPRQQPQVEGGIDQGVFGGSVVEAPGYISIKKVQNSKTIQIGQGWMHGLYKGTVFGLFPPETRDPFQTRPLMKGTLALSEPFQSMITLDSAVDKKLLNTAWVYVLERNFGDLKAQIKIQLDPGNPVAEALRARMKTLPVIQENDKTPDLFVVQKEGKIQLMYGNYTLEAFSIKNNSSVAASRLIKRILLWTQADYLRSLQTEQEDMLLKVSIIPMGKNPTTKAFDIELPIKEKTDASGNIRFKLGDAFLLQVTNEGEKPTYFTLLDLSPDDSFVILAPSKSETAEEFYLLPGQTIQLKQTFNLGPPSGTELIKVIATDVPIDLRPIMSTRGIGKKTNPSPLETLFAETYLPDENMTRGGKTTNVSSKSMHIETFSFIIEE
jgi:hypothetical protein